MEGQKVGEGCTESGERGCACGRERSFSAPVCRRNVTGKSARGAVWLATPWGQGAATHSLG